MNTLSAVAESSILSVISHPDDVEMHHAGLLSRSQNSVALIATDGEASTINHARRSLC